jgi:hypothetical protein
MSMNEILNDVAQYRERKWTRRAMINQRIYLDIRGYEYARTIKSEMANAPRKPSASGMHIQ